MDPSLKVTPTTCTPGRVQWRCSDATGSSTAVLLCFKQWMTSWRGRKLWSTLHVAFAPPPPQVRYLPTDQSFNADNLEVSIVLNGEEVTWSPTPAVNASLNGNLLGTIRVSYCFLQSLGLFHNVIIAWHVLYCIAPNLEGQKFFITDWPFTNFMKVINALSNHINLFEKLEYCHCPVHSAAHCPVVAFRWVASVEWCMCHISLCLCK